MFNSQKFYISLRLSAYDCTYKGRAKWRFSNGEKSHLAAFPFYACTHINLFRALLARF